jgi:DNA-binding transcriptional regulator YiaG
VGGDQRENLADMDRKGRRRWGVLRGERNPNAKLSPDAVLAIRRAYATGKVRQQDLAATFGVSRALISDVTTRRRWRHTL